MKLRKHSSLLVALLSLCSTAFAQPSMKSNIETHIRFLSSDELRGRETGDIGLQIAGRYIAEQFRRTGVDHFDHLDDYFQWVPFKKVAPPSSFSLQIGDSLYTESDLIVLNKHRSRLESEVIFIDFESAADLNLPDLQGKIVLTQLGHQNTKNAQEGFQYSSTKRKLVQERGGLALIEIYQGRLPWKLLRNYLGQDRIILDKVDGIDTLTHLVLNHPLTSQIQDLQQDVTLEAAIEIQGGQVARFKAANIVGLVRGTDPALNQSYIVCSAHYDHVGVRKRPDRPLTEFDSVFNGARDNAIGVAAVLSAAEVLSKNPPKRSVLLVAFAGEEIGLLGSKYFVENAPVPLSNIIFNLNTDGAGYSDTSIISIMGLNRVGAGDQLTAACSAFGLDAYADPAPEQGLFDRSDNVNFAQVGIPAPTFSPGFRNFDQAILKTYHQPTDEADSLDFSYLHRFCQAYALSAKLIGDLDQAPRWSAGDKYEQAFEKLYNP